MPFRLSVGRRAATLVAILAGLALTSRAQQQNPAREFRPGTVHQISDLPVGRFRSLLERLPAPARNRAVAWLGNFHFTDLDLQTLQVDADGGIYYADPQSDGATGTAPPEPGIAGASVPVSPFPAGLIFHSRPGAPNTLFLNFSGETVSGTAWNTSLGRSTIPAVAFSTDADYSTFSDSEQQAIKRVWQRVAEDYAPFDIDVTTERPATFGNRVAHALITRNTDANGQPNPSSTAGGVSYVGVFGGSSYSSYRPSWIYFNNLANDESYIAEATSHEIGHNMGLSHDGTTSGSEYYGGHGTGYISWGPIMGTGYNRNVSQWSKGEYYLANNTQDDLATIAAKVSYRADDAGNTPATAKSLTVFGGTTITSTTPETDPDNTSPANKGVLETSSDVDVWSFVTGTGPISITVNPWIVAGGRTRGGNVDLLLELFDSQGALLLTNNPATDTVASLQTNLTDGVYYLQIGSTGAGDPFSSSPTGYTVYGSIGQYFISGSVTPSSYIIPPGAVLAATDINQPGQPKAQFTVTYSDNAAIAAATIDGSDIQVTGPNGYARLARLVGKSSSADTTPITATYEIDPPSGVAWAPNDNGTYHVVMQAAQVGDTEGAWVTAGELGHFTVSVPTVIYFASMDTNPGWTLQPLWQFGVPAYGSTGPSSGSTGSTIIGYNLSGNYENRLSAVYATTPPINCPGATVLTLRFQRWLRLRSGDTATIQASTNGVDWVDVWSTTKSVTDSAWQPVQYTLPGWTSGSPALQLRWGMASGTSQNDIGWNIDDVELLGNGTLDTTPPAPSLNIANLTTGGSPTHEFTVTYTDNVAVDAATLGAGDLVVTGPNGYSNLVAFVGVDLPGSGSPRTATYSIVAPNGTWSEADNGVYQIVLRPAEVGDTSGNFIDETPLGQFTVAIVAPQEQLIVASNNPDWGTVNPSGGSYPAGSSVVVTASPSQYYQFIQWSGDVTATSNPLAVTLNSNVTLTAEFGEIVTMGHGTPYWWLAAQGHTNDFENAENLLGANQMPLWESYVAGLDPVNPDSQFQFSIGTGTAAGTIVLRWNPVAGRSYTVLQSTNVRDPFLPIASATSLPASVNTTTLSNPPPDSLVFYRMMVQMEK